MKRVAWLACVVALIVSTSCTPPSPSTLTGSTDNQSGGAPPIVAAFQAIDQHSVDPVNPVNVGTAGVKGLRGALLADGIMPPQVPMPTFTNDASADASKLDASVEGALQRYSSKLTPDQAEDAVISAMADSMGNCHTSYVPPDQFQQQIAQIQGRVQFGGIGAFLRKPKPSDPLVIWRVFANTPAAKAGLKDGDVIQAVDGRNVSSDSVKTVADLIRGPVGTPVHLTIVPAGQKEARVVTVVRGQIQPPNVEYRMLPDQIGYVQLYDFPENVAGQMKSALDALDRDGAKGWIIDVRDNGGGALQAVTQVLSMFLPKNTLLFYLYDASGRRTDYTADGSVRAHLPPIVILANDGTGSGGEIFTGVLQERGVAKVVGTQTAGCVGTGQIFPLSNGGGIQVAVDKLITGRGRVLNHIGVTPNVSVTTTIQDLTSGKDPQLQRGIQLLQSEMAQ